MLTLRNRTALAAAIVVLPDAEGIDTLVVAVKAGRAFSGEPLPAAILPEDRFSEVDAEVDGAPLLELPGDLGLPKPATDVLVTACAYAPGGSARACAAGFSVGPVRKRLLVSGDRRWRRRLFAWRASDPEPFARMPLTWRRAAGGPEDERNPLGVGLAPAEHRTAQRDAPLPNVEYPDHPLRAPTQRPCPAGIGAVAAHWQPRRARAGTYDERWRRERAPYLPTDFDQRFLCCAPTDQVAPGYLRGDEEVELDRLTPAGRTAFALCAPRMAIEVRVGRARHACTPRLDTVVIDAERGAYSLLWRATWRCDAEPTAIATVEIADTEA